MILRGVLALSLPASTSSSPRHLASLPLPTASPRPRLTSTTPMGHTSKPASPLPQRHVSTPSMRCARALVAATATTPW